MRKRSLIIVLAVVLLVSFLAISCSPAQRPGPVEQPPAPANPAPNRNDNNNNMTNEESAKADRLAERIARMKDINSATVVLADNSAWVGVDFKANVSLTEGVKDEITRIVKNEDKSIDTVYVTADADTVTRLRNIARDIAAGRPVSGFIDELREMGKRIMPSAR